MNSQLNQAFNHMKGKYVQKYGELMDEWSLMLFHEIHENFTSLASELTRSANGIDKAAAAIKGSQKSIHFKDKQQALYFGLGIFAPVSMTAALVSILIFWYAYTNQSFEEKKEVIQAYKNVMDYKLLMQYGEIIQRDGTNYLVLHPVSGKGDINIGAEYVYDQKNKDVLVPLGRTRH